MYFKSILIAALTCLSTSVGAAELIRKQSPHSVAVTIDRLEQAVKKAGATVFVRVNHGEGVNKAGSALRPTETLIFGNPKLGAPAMMAAQSTGLDLPLRALAFEDEKGQVHLIYHNPSELSEIHGLAKDAAVIKKMTGALNKLTNKAIAK